MLQKPQIMICLAQYMICQQRQDHRTDVTSGNPLCSCRFVCRSAISVYSVTTSPESNSILYYYMQVILSGPCSLQ